MDTRSDPAHAHTSSSFFKARPNARKKRRGKRGRSLGNRRRRKKRRRKKVGIIGEMWNEGANAKTICLPGGEGRKERKLGQATTMAVALSSPSSLSFPLPSPLRSSHCEKLTKLPSKKKRGEERKESVLFSCTHLPTKLPQPRQQQQLVHSSPLLPPRLQSRDIGVVCGSRKRKEEEEGGCRKCKREEGRRNRRLKGREERNIRWSLYYLFS